MFTFHVLDRKVWLPRDGKNVRTHPVEGLSDRILVAHGTGDIYVQQWREGGNRGEPKRRLWRRHGTVQSAYRGMVVARESALRQRIPLLQQLHALCQRANLILGGKGMQTPQTLGEVKAFIRRFLDAIRTPQTHALKEARVQVERVATLKDTRGRTNYGALAARLVPVKDRLLRERIKDIIGWIGHYAHWGDDLALLEQLAGGFLPDLLAAVDRWLQHLNGRPPAMARAAFDVELGRYGETIAQLEPFGGWMQWARACRTDVRTTQHAIRRGAVAAARCAIERLRLATHLKARQRELSQLMLDIKLGQIGATLDWPAYRRRIAALRDEFGRLDDRALRRPVAEKIIAALTSAAEVLASPAPERTRVKGVRDHLRVACELL